MLSRVVHVKKEISWRLSDSGGGGFPAVGDALVISGGKLAAVLVLSVSVFVLRLVSEFINVFVTGKRS